MTDATTRLLAHGRGIAVTAKRTYRLVRGGRCVLAGEQLPLVEVPEGSPPVLLHDSDLLAFKPATDVVVKASAHAPGGRAVRELEAGITVGEHRTLVRVSGPRRVVRRDGSWAFSDAGAFTSSPLTWSEAYGGVDTLTRPRLDAETIDPLRPWLDVDLTDVTLAAYPRNPVGKGYVIEERAEAEGMELPSVEDPDDLLTPSRLFAGHPHAWFRQPVAAGLGWVSYGWFPRLAFCGLPQLLLPPGATADTARVLEVERGHAPAGLFSPRPIADRVSDRAANGASPRLVFEPHLRGHEEFVLHALDPQEPDLAFELPHSRPTIAIQPLREAEHEVPASLMTVLVDVPERRVSLVWAASVQPLLPHQPELAEKVGYRVEW